MVLKQKKIRAHKINDKTYFFYKGTSLPTDKKICQKKKKRDQFALGIHELLFWWKWKMHVQINPSL